MKKKVILSIIAVILASIVAFCLIYTRPRTLDGMLGGRKIVSVTAHASLYQSVFALEDPPSPWSHWSLDGDDIDEQAILEITDLLNTSKYRTKLISLTNPNSATGNGKSEYQVIMTVSLEDATLCRITCLGTVIVFDLPEEGYTITSATNQQITTKLGEYISQVGELEQ